MTNKNYDLDLKLKEQNKLIELLKGECDSYSAKLSQLAEKESSLLNEERASLRQSIEKKDHHYQSLIEEINELNKKRQEADRIQIDELKSRLNEMQEEISLRQTTQTTTLLKSSKASLFHEDLSGQVNDSNNNNSVASLKYENQQLSKQLDELKYSYDDLIDEKNQLLLTLNELKQKSRPSGASSNESISNDINEVIKLNTLLKV